MKMVMMIWLKLERESSCHLKLPIFWKGGKRLASGLVLFRAVRPRFSCRSCQRENCSVGGRGPSQVHAECLLDNSLSSLSIYFFSWMNLLQKKRESPSSSFSPRWAFTKTSVVFIILIPSRLAELFFLVKEAGWGEVGPQTCKVQWIVPTSLQI